MKREDEKGERVRRPEGREVVDDCPEDYRAEMIRRTKLGRSRLMRDLREVFRWKGFTNFKGPDGGPFE